MKREYVVTVPRADVARLRAFDNKVHGATPWPLGPNRTFRRKNASTFVVKEYAGGALSGALVMTRGTATLVGEDQVAVTVATKGHALGYLLIGCGLVAGGLTLRDGLPALLVGTVLVLAGWFLFARRSGLADDLDDVEKVLRAEIPGLWRPIGAPAGPEAGPGPPGTAFETANRLTNFLHGDDRDVVAATPTGWSVTDLLRARTILDEGALRVRRRGRTVASLPVGTIAFLAQVPWVPDLVNEYPAVETWVVGHDGRPVAVIGWDTRVERQARDAGIAVRRFAHGIDRDVIPTVWTGRPSYPVAVHVEPARS